MVAKYQRTVGFWVFATMVFCQIIFGDLDSSKKAGFAKIVQSADRTRVVLIQYTKNWRELKMKTMAMPAARALRSKSSPGLRACSTTAVCFPLQSLSRLSGPLIFEDDYFDFADDRSLWRKF